MSNSVRAWIELLESMCVHPEDGRAKIERIVGSIESGDAKNNEFFGVLHGPSMSGKSTIFNILKSFFKDKTVIAQSTVLEGPMRSFELESMLAKNPRLILSHDTIPDRVDFHKLNVIISHAKIVIEEMHKGLRLVTPEAFLFLATRSFPKQFDETSWLKRRMIDIQLREGSLPPLRYFDLLSWIDQDRGAVLEHCFKAYKETRI